MPKTTENNYSAQGSQPELPSELLPTPADGSAEEQATLATDQIRQQAEEIAQDSRIPEAVRTAVAQHVIEVSKDFDRVDKQGQTTTNGPDARSRAKVETEEDRSNREILEITKRARRVVDTPAQQRAKTVREANIKRHYGETGPSSKAKGEI